MESIVSPWIIYLLGMLPEQGDMPLAAVVFIIFIVIGFIRAMIFIDTPTPEELFKKIWLTPMLVIFLISIPVTILIPSKSTLIQMYVANEITYDRAEKAVEIGKDIIQEVTKEETVQGIDIDDIYIVYSKKEYVKHKQVHRKRVLQ